MNKPKFGRSYRVRNLMIVMSAVVVLLLGIIVVLMVLNFKNKDENENDADPTPVPTKAVSFATATPTGEIKVTDVVKVTATPTAAPTKTPTKAVTATPAVTVAPTMTLAPVATNTPVPTVVPTDAPAPVVTVTGLDKVPSALKTTAETLARETAENDIVLNGYASTQNVKISTYTFPKYVSLLFTCTSGDRTHSEAATFDATTYKKLSASDMFNESYLAIIKERLQTAAVKEDSAFSRTSFVDYDTAYNAADYNNFYIHGSTVTFIFPNGTLTEVIHKEFTYDVKLSEAKAFMYYDTDGNRVGAEIRTNLDPTKPMIAITFDDGPYRPVDERLLEVFEENDARCTFFVLGSRIDSAESCKESVKALAAAGQEIASLTYSSTSYTSEDCDKKTFWTNINKNSLLLANTVGYAPSYIRFPGGSDRLKYMSENLPLPIINWTLDSRDWVNGVIYTDKVTEDEYNKIVTEDYLRVVENAADGQIVLFHSLYHTTVDTVNQVMLTLSCQDYQFVTVSELLYYKGIDAVNGTVTYGAIKGEYNKDYSK